jgi:hypothetical protein
VPKEKPVDTIATSTSSDLPDPHIGPGDGNDPGNPATETLPCRKLTDKLYECLAHSTSCSEQFPFGSRKFCLWLLKNFATAESTTLPCKQSGVKKQAD